MLKEIASDTERYSTPPSSQINDLVFYMGMSTDVWSGPVYHIPVQVKKGRFIRSTATPASISTEGVTDTDMNVIPPEGVTVIISNDTVTVTNQAVDIATAEEDEDEAGTEEEEEEEPEDETEEVDTE